MTEQYSHMNIDNSKTIKNIALQCIYLKYE
jgi:hypothetical protein